MNPQNAAPPGLTHQQAKEILARDGYNELLSEKPKSFLFIFFKIMAEPMFVLLSLSILIYFLMGEIKDTLFLFVSILLIVFITLYQQKKAAKTLEKLKNLSSPSVDVIRGGEKIQISSRELVVGDVVLLHEGNRVPADGFIFSCSNLTVDESILTGESVAVNKTFLQDQKYTQPGGVNTPFVYSSTLVVSGYGVMCVLKTGMNTEVGKIGKSLREIRKEDTLLKKEIDKIVKIFFLLALSMCLAVLLVYALIRGDLIQGILSGITLGMALIPEEFPVVLLIFLTLGAWRISKKNVLTKNNSAIETLGAATVLCVDKTGTLTQNKMEIDTLFDGNTFLDFKQNKSNISDSFYDILKFSYLSCQKDSVDPLEKEITKYTLNFAKERNENLDSYILQKEYSVSNGGFYKAGLYKTPKGQYFVGAKGAPEAIFGLCELSENKKHELLSKVQEMSERGLRVLAGCKGVDDKYEFLGLIGFSDPVRDGVSKAVQNCYTAGIRVIMITGDYPGTAVSIATQIGLENSQVYLTGSDLEKMKHSDLREALKTVNVFARIQPILKLSIVEVLKLNGEIVAMTGDGVNDAPALKSAHIGISMGKKGTDVARETSDLVLIDDNFVSIVSAIRLGRQIFDNLKKAISYIFSIHIPISGMALLPLAFNMPPMLFPAHIAFLELVIDPSCSTVFESQPEEDNIMNKPPRNLKEPMIGKKIMIFGLLQGLSVLVVVFLIYFIYLKLNKGVEYSRTMSFSTLVFANLLLILLNLSWKKNILKTLFSGNKILLIVLTLTFVFLVMCIYVPFVRSLFYFSYLPVKDFLLTFILAFVSLIWFEAYKIFTKRLI